MKYPADMQFLADTSAAVAGEADKIVATIMEQANEHARKASELFAQAHALSTAIKMHRVAVARVIPATEPPSPGRSETP